MTDAPEQAAMLPTQLIQEEMAPTQLITANEDDQKIIPEPLQTIENVEGIRDISAQPTFASQDNDDLLGMLGSQDPEEQIEQQCDEEEDAEIQKEDEPDV